MRFMIVLVAVLAIPVLSLSKTINVPGDFNTIQEAIDAAINGDTVLVHPGTYVENIDFKGKEIAVHSDNGPAVTIIDGNHEGSVVVFVNHENNNAVLSGFTITNGSGTFYQGLNYGGGIFCYNDASPIINKNIVVANQSNNGGGLACFGIGIPLINDCVISNNYSLNGNRGGGGIYLEYSNAIINNCTINNNFTDFQGGGIKIFHGGSPEITNNIIDSNEAISQGGGIYSSGNNETTIHCNIITNNMAFEAGGVYVDAGKVSNNIISYNTAKRDNGSVLYGSGGGLSVTGNFPLITDNVISHNNAMMFGGGIVWSAGDGKLINNIISYNSCKHGTVPSGLKEGGAIWFINYSGSSTIINCYIVNNESEDIGGGIYVRKNAGVQFINCTLSNNTALSGGGVYCNHDAELSFHNSIIYGNSTDEIYYETNMPNIKFCDVKGGWPGTGNIDADPLFVDSTNNDFHITFTSPCKDTGNNFAVAESTDFECDPRIAYGTVDMGADEFYTHLYWTGDATPGGNVELKLVGLPGTTPVGLCIGTGVLDPPIPSIWGDWYLQFPIIGPIALGQIPSPDGVLVIPGTIPASPPAPYSLPMQALIGAELSNLAILEVK